MKYILYPLNRITKHFGVLFVHVSSRYEDHWEIWTGCSEYDEYGWPEKTKRIYGEKRL